MQASNTAHTTNKQHAAYVLRKTSSVETADRAMASIIRSITAHMAAHPGVALLAKVGAEATTCSLTQRSKNEIGC